MFIIQNSRMTLKIIYRTSGRFSPHEWFQCGILNCAFCATNSAWKLLFFNSDFSWDFASKFNNCAPIHVMFCNSINIFHKTEVLTVILRNLMDLNFNLKMLSVVTPHFFFFKCLCPQVLILRTYVSLS